MIDMRVLVWPDGQEKLQYRYLNYPGQNGAYWSSWQDVPRVDYRAAPSTAALDSEGEKK